MRSLALFPQSADTEQQLPSFRAALASNAHFYSGIIKKNIYIYLCLAARGSGRLGQLVLSELRGSARQVARR